MVIARDRDTLLGFKGEATAVLSVLWCKMCAMVGKKWGSE